ncbi:MAG: cadmium-translocating P-type ATPase [Thermoplasmatales archaeon]|nr:cadmium-translocating P-type ATPase [Thermoplasmatales archaeon]
MHCEGCAKAIEKYLRNKEGIISANVSFSLGKAFIEYDERLNEKRLKELIKEAGYEVEEGKKSFWRAIFSLILTIPILIISLFFYRKELNVILFLLATPLQIFAGYPFYRGAYFSLKQKTADLNVLVSISTTSAYLYSALSTFFFDGMVFYEASSVVLTTVTIGLMLEERAREKVGETIKKLIELKPKRARVFRNRREEEISSDEIEKEDVVIVRSGEKIPVDGIIIEGFATIDESSITGESIPVDKKEGDEVFSGSINMSGFFKFRATRVGKDTFLSQTISLVEEAQTSKAKIQRLADKITNYFVPLVIFISFLSFIFWYFITNAPFPFALTISISVLVIACPCALGIATPTAILVGISLSAEKGILVKGGEYLEKFAEVDTLVFDKTGTLTKGKAEVSDVIGDVLQVAGSLASKSNHPIALAIYNEAKRRGVKILEVKEFSEIPGKGIVGKINGKEAMLGNRELINSKIGEELEKEGKTVVLVYFDGIIGAIALMDEIKENAIEAIKKLEGYEIFMITGDNRKIAEAIAKKLGIEKIIAGVLPHEKDKEIINLQKKGKIVAAVGDGINDAPMLSRADVGIAMGGGSDISKEAGGIIIVKDNLMDVVQALNISKATFSKIKQNLFLAFIYNVIAVPVACGALYPWLGFILRPEFSAIAMVSSDIAVVGNSLLLRKKLRKTD